MTAPAGIGDAHRYDIDPSATGIVRAAFSWWTGDLLTFAAIGAVPLVPVGLGLLALGIALVVSALQALWFNPDEMLRSPLVTRSLTAICALSAVLGAAACNATLIAVARHARAQEVPGAWACTVAGLRLVPRLGLVLVLLLCALALWLVVGLLLAAVLLAVLGVSEEASGVVSLGVCLLVGFAGSVWTAARLAPGFVLLLVDGHGVAASARYGLALTRGNASMIVSALVVLLASCTAALIGMLVPLLGIFVLAALPALVAAFAVAIYAACLTRYGDGPPPR